jgi:hypothetical protein
MDVYYSPYELTALKSANRLSSTGKKIGIHLMASIEGKKVYADYFPHEVLGDRSVEQFLTEFQTQDHEYDRKLLHFLKQDGEYQNLKTVRFQNHQLIVGDEKPIAPVIKYKIQNTLDLKPIEILKSCITLRLDANGLFRKSEYEAYFDQFPRELLTKIEYVEDPLADINWGHLSLRSARDRIEGIPSHFIVYKPNREFIPRTPTPTIFSSYLGSDLGTWHAYCELMAHGDLTRTHGIYTKGHYQEEKTFLFGSYREGFSPDLNKVRSIYQDLSKKTWKSLCSI